MIAGLARAGAILEEPTWIGAAEKAAAFFLDKMWDAKTGQLWRRWAGGDRKVEGQLDDYAFLAWGLLELHQADLQPRWLEACLALVQAAQTRFADSDGLYFLAGREGDPRLPARVKETHDNVEPSAVSVLVDVQLRLWSLGGDAGLREAAEKTLKAVAPDMAKNPRGQCFMISALDRFLSPPVHVVLAGDAASPGIAGLRAGLRGLFLPQMDLVGAKSDGTLPLPGALVGYNLKDGSPAAYVCVGLACQAPVSSKDALLQTLQTL
jgi:uncharacterized protein YyaL (SSP411 family)